MTTDNSLNCEEVVNQIHEQYTSEGLSDCWNSEMLSISAAIKAIFDVLPKGRYQPVKILGVGGSGIVIRLQDKLFPQIDKALKFPRPLEGKINIISEMLKKEISYLSELRYRGIVAITDYGQLSSVRQYTTLPYYIMEFVDGCKSAAYVRDPTTTEHNFKLLVLSTAQTINYFHTKAPQHFAHLDIKSDNVMASSDGSSTIIDLGTCKRLGADDANTIVMCTRSNAHPELIRKLVEDPSEDNRAKGEISRSQIDLSWDLWSFGLMLLDWLGIDRDNGNIDPRAIYFRLSSYARKYYLLLAARLLSYSVKSWLSDRIGLSDRLLKDFPLTSSFDLVEALSRLDDNYKPFDKIEEFRDPSSGSIQAIPGRHVSLTSALAELIEHRLFRRLNNINQLGLVSQVFPGAKYTRREHSLGTYANTVLLINSLYNDGYSPLFRQVVTEGDCRALLLASLIHDIGQFPLAHDLEEIDKQIFSHADLTHAMLRGEWSRKKRGTKPITFPSFTTIFEHWGTTRDRVANILSAKPYSTGFSRKDKYLRSLFSSPIDADKLDYLYRDALHTGVPYPLGIDRDRLLRCVTTVIVDPGSKDIPFIGIHSKGKVAGEFLALARYAMFSQVYWHHAVRSQKAMLARAVGALLAKLDTDDLLDQFKADFLSMVTSLPEILYSETSKDRQLLLGESAAKIPANILTMNCGTDLFTTDAAVLEWLAKRLRSYNMPHAQLLDGLLRRKLYKRLWIVSHDKEPNCWSEIVDSWDKLGRVNKNKAYNSFEQQIAQCLKTPDKAKDITTMKAKTLVDIIDEKTKGEIPWLLIDIPGARPGSDVPLKYVLEGQRRKLRKNDRVVGDLQNSVIWENYSRDIRKAAGKVRIFCDPELAEPLEVSISPEEGLQALKEALSENL